MNAPTDKRIDPELRQAIDGVRDSVVRNAFEVLARRTVGYATRNWDFIHRYLRIAQAGLSVLFVATLILGIRSVDLSSQNGQRIHDIKGLATATNGALCALRIDLETRVATTEKFLHDHPGGFAGIPAATIRNSLTGQQHTIRALSGLTCRPTR